MGKQAQLKRFRKWLRDRVARGVAHPDAARSYYRQAKGRRSPEDTRARAPRTGASEVMESVQPHDAKNFHVGMSISGPPEMFGLPPDPGCAVHTTGTPGCAACYPPRAPVTVTAVDHESGTITLSTAATSMGNEGAPNGRDVFTSRR